ncbi:MAG: peptidylprolyl isomerase, partial [Bacteroidaceae bacterium]|nr:peptidylprolyl isomerase [Bacteroidaceae bacterium]
MKQFVVLFYLLLVTPFIVAQTANADPVIMTVDGKKVLKSEFDYFLNKNNTSETPLTKKEIKEYADLFLNF